MARHNKRRLQELYGVQNPIMRWLLLESTVVKFFDHHVCHFIVLDAKAVVEVAIMLWKVVTLMLVFQLNYTFPPSTQRQCCHITVFAYYFGVFLFFLDNFTKFAATSAQVAFRFHTVYNNCTVKAQNIIDLMLMVVNGLLYHSFMSFFWNKMFLGEKDVLLVYRTNFVDEFKHRGNEDMPHNS